jgi:YfiR/HmsC-like
MSTREGSKRHIGKSQRQRRMASWLTAVAPLLIALPGLWAQRSKPTDYQVKAAYLFNFGRFIEWPASAKGDSFTICILGQDPFGATLDAALANQTIDGKSVAAKRISTLQESSACQILFLSSSEEARLPKIVESLDKSAVLTVSDMPGFSQRGGMIQFILDGNKVRFEVNLTAAQSAGLNPSSELLRVATTVRRDSRPRD